jgi:hypothetical protein
VRTRRERDAGWDASVQGPTVPITDEEISVHVVSSSQNAIKEGSKENGRRKEGGRAIEGWEGGRKFTDRTKFNINRRNPKRKIW